MRESITSMRNV